MATVPMVIAVRRNTHGDVVKVLRGIADTATNFWIDGGEPAPIPVIKIVDSLLAGDAVWSRLPNGAPGPKLKVVLAKAGHGIESVELDDATLTVADLAHF